MLIEPPFIITPRLLPGIRIGDALISIEHTGRTDNRGAGVWTWYIDLAGVEYSGSDLSGWGDYRDVIATLLSFLSAFSEAVRYSRGLRESDNLRLFPEGLRDWAEAHGDEFCMIAYDVENPEPTED